MLSLGALLLRHVKPLIPATALEVTCTSFGGHCGFYDGQGELTWIEREVLATLSRRQQ